jgi:Zn-dependent peptidase ImmA (M78 family)
MYAFVSDLGGCIFINRKHPAERQRASMSHEYGHLIGDRYKPGIDYVAFEGRKPSNERFAESFGTSFLMPASSIRRHVNQIVTTTGDFRVADLCRLSHHYFVSVEAMSYRLEGLGLIPRGTAEHLRESGFAVRKAKALLELPSQSESGEPYPQRYKFLAIQAYEQERISEGQLARFLRCDRVTAREIVADCLTAKNVSANGEIETLQLDFQHSLFGEEQ